jgi:hypothetical protein
VTQTVIDADARGNRVHHVGPPINVVREHVDGVDIDIVQLRFWSIKHFGDKPVENIAETCRAYRAGGYTTGQAHSDFYLHASPYHKAGERAGYESGFTPTSTPLSDPCTSVNSARSAARRTLRKLALLEQYTPLVLASIRSMRYPDFVALPVTTSTTVKVGDLVAVHSAGQYRVGVAVQLAKSSVDVFTATPSGNGRIYTKTAKYGDVRHWSA